MALFTDLYREGDTVVFMTHEPGSAAYTERTVRLHAGLIKSDAPDSARSVDPVGALRSE